VRHAGKSGYFRMVGHPETDHRRTWGFQLTFYKGFIDDDFRCDIAEFTPLPRLHLFPHRFKVALHPIDADRNAIDQRERFECLASTGVNTPETILLSSDLDAGRRAI